MKEKTVFETAIGKLKHYAWLSYDLPDGDMQNIEDDEAIAVAAKIWKMSPEAVGAIRQALNFMAESIIEAVEEDLRDIWKAAGL